MSEPIRVLLADDQRVVREGLTLILDLLEDVEVVDTASDGQQAVEMAERLAPDVVLMDLRMPRVDGIEATRQLAASRPRIGVIALTTYADDASVLGALRAGARGYLTKDASAEQIAAAINRVAEGEASLDEAIQTKVVEAVTAGAGAEPAVSDGDSDELPDDREEPRQPSLRQDRRPRPGPGGGLRVPARPRHPGRLTPASIARRRRGVRPPARPAAASVDRRARDP
jgi:DNA-binding NarL/FixJ family response regulator